MTSTAAKLIREIQQSDAVLASRVLELEEVEWLARDFVVSCPELPNHPTVRRLFQWFGDSA